MPRLFDLGCLCRLAFLQVDADGDRVKGSEEVCLFRHPTAVFGGGDNATTSVFTVTDLDRAKVTCPPLFRQLCSDAHDRKDSPPALGG